MLSHSRRPLCEEWRRIQMTSVCIEQTLISLLMLRRPGSGVSGGGEATYEDPPDMWATNRSKHPHTNSHPRTGDVWYHRTACCRPYRGRRREKCDAAINTYPRIIVIISFAYCKWLISSKQNLHELFKISLHTGSIYRKAADMHCSSATMKNPQSCPHT